VKNLKILMFNLFILSVLGVHFSLSAGCSCPIPSAADKLGGSGGAEGARNRSICPVPTAQEKLNGSGGAERAVYGDMRKMSSTSAISNALSNNAQEDLTISSDNSLEWINIKYPNLKNLCILVKYIDEMPDILDQLAQFPLLEKVEFYFGRVVTKESMSDEVMCKILTLTHLKEIRYTFSVDRDYYYGYYSYYSGNLDYLNKQREFLQQYTSTIIHIECTLGVDEKCG